jgi:hypothetical protein
MDLRIDDVILPGPVRIVKHQPIEIARLLKDFDQGPEVGEEILEIPMGIERFDVLHPLVPERMAMEAGQLENEFGCHSAFQMNMEFRFRKGADEGGEVSGHGASFRRLISRGNWEPQMDIVEQISVFGNGTAKRQGFGSRVQGLGESQSILQIL